MAETADIQTQPFYLKKAKIKGYKSIKDAEVEFHDGLNIIIGKNASGKSNLLEILFSTLKLNTHNRFLTKAELTLRGLKDLKISANYISNNRLKLNPKSRIGVGQTEFKFVYDNNTIDESEEPQSMHVSFIKYNIPDFNNYPIIPNPFSFKFYVKEHFADIDVEKIESQFVLFIIFELTRSPHLAFFSWPLDKNKFISSLDDSIKNLNHLFAGLAPIEEIRFNPYINIHYEEQSEILTFSNIFLEYKINGNWLPYSCLSDGTKRLFYIISELYAEPNLSYPDEWYSFKSENISKNIILLEEPELGIHPHQLHRLMTFIKEQSRDKQIILSTHSPMVLDVLGKDDLHRIIIASNDDPMKGSQFRHLTEKEMDKARLYMDGDFLSDYWKYSDLER